MFLAHFSGDGLQYWYEQPSEECFKQFNIAVKVFNDIQPKYE